MRSVAKKGKQNWVDALLTVAICWDSELAGLVGAGSPEGTRESLVTVSLPPTASGTNGRLDTKTF